MGFALTSASLTKIKFIIPNITREKEYVQAWAARLYDRAPTAQLQSPQCRLSTVWSTELALNTWQWCFYSYCCQWQETCGGKVKQQSCLSLEPLSIQGSVNTICSLYRQVVNPTYVQGVCQTHWLQVIQFLLITILETISRNEVCLRKRKKKGITTTNRGNWGGKTFKVLIYWIPILFE